MDEAPTSQPAPDGVQQCQQAFAADLDVRYEDVQIIPTRDNGVRRYLATRRGGGSSSLICLRTYAEPLGSWEITQQRTLLEQIRQTHHPRLCPVMDYRFEAHGHYIVSGPVGSVALYEFLRQHRHLAFTPLCELIGTIAEALEAAVEARWPKCSIDVHSLLTTECSVDSIRNGVRIPVPPLPGIELRTPQFPAVPTTSAAYVQDLALLVCDLLGSPARTQRFKRTAQVGAAANNLLRFVLEGQWQTELTSARAFANALRQTDAKDASKAAPFSVSPIVSFGEYSSSTTQPPTPIPSTTQSQPQHQPQPQPPQPVAPAPRPTQTAATVSVPPPQASAKALTALPRQLPVEGSAERLRLIPRGSTSATSVTLCLASQLTVGRVNTCDHIAQFFPRNPKNDDRTRMISRDHLRLQFIDGKPWLIESKDVNPSFVGGQPLSGRLKLSSFTRVTIAGEYDLELRHLPSWWSIGQLWQGQTTAREPSGALLLAPMPGHSALENKTLWLFTDAAFGITAEGALDLQPASTRDVIGWLLRDEQSLYVVTAESHGLVSLNDEALKAMQPRPLKPSDVLRVGTVDLELATVPVPS